ncbi:MAG TPA: hypothetical protein VK831_02495 [Candidatus Deferrimicrobiaceae bacterium]|nr:hypothetical protein [Candidatus Deferrimicrobiaceae bacterium]
MDPSFQTVAHFEAAEDTADRLARAGFDEIETWLSEEPTMFGPGRPFEAHPATVALREHVTKLGTEAG